MSLSRKANRSSHLVNRQAIRSLRRAALSVAPLSMAVAATLSAMGASAATNTYDGGNGTVSWNVPGSWTNGIPASSDDVLIGTGKPTGTLTLTLDADQIINSLTINNSQTITVSAGTSGTLDLLSGNLTRSGSGNDTISGPLILGDSTNTAAYTGVFSNTSSSNGLTLSGVISTAAGSNASGLTFAGFGTSGSQGAFTINGAAGPNTYVGLTTVTSNASVSLGKATAVSGDLTITSNVADNTRVYSTVNNSLASTANVSISGQSTNTAWYLSGSVTQTIASLTMNGGQINQGALGVLTINGPLNLTANANSQVYINSNNTGTIALGGDINATSAATGGNNVQFANGGTISLNGARTFTVTKGGGSAVTDLYMTSILADGTGGAQGFTKEGNGVLQLTAIDTYTGATTINNGTLSIAGVSATNSSSSVTVNSGARFQAAVANAKVGNVIVNSGGFFRLSAGQDTTAGAVAPVSAIAGTLEINSSVGANYPLSLANGSTIKEITYQATFASNLTLAGTVGIDTSLNQLTLSGVLSGSGANVTVSGANPLYYSGTAANTYSGTTTLTGAGTLLILGKTGVNAIAGNVIIGDGTTASTLKLNAANQIADTANVTVNTGSIFNLNTFTETLGSLTSSGTVTSGTLTAGPVTINGGTISSALVTTGVLTLGSGATVSGAVTLGGDVAFNGATTGATLGNGAITLNGSRTFTIARGTSATDLTVTGVLSNGTVAPSSITKAGPGILRLNATNTYTGNTTIASGTLQLGSATAITNSASQQLIFGDSVANTPGTLDINGFSQTFVNLANAGTSNANLITNTSASAATFTYSDTGLTDVWNSKITLTGTTLNFQKSGAGTLSFNTAQSYGGITTIATGTVKLGLTNALPTGTTLNAATGTFDLNNFDQTVSGIGNSGTITNSGANVHTLTINQAGTSPGLTGTFSGNLAIVQGSGTVVFNDARTNTYTGGYTLNSGTVDLSSGNSPKAFGAGTLHLVNGSITNANTGNAITVASPISIEGNPTFGGTAGFSTQGFYFSGPVTLNTVAGVNPVITSTFNPGSFTNASGPNILGTVGDGSLGVGFTKAGTGTLGLAPTVANTFTGPVVIQAGTLFVNTLAFSSSNTNDIVIDNTATGSDAALMEANIVSGNGGGGTVNVTRNITLKGGASGADILGLAQPCCNGTTTGTYSGNITLKKNLTLMNTGTGVLNLTGNIAESGGSYQIISTGNITVSNAANGTASPTFTGGTVINSGTFQWKYIQAAGIAVPAMTAFGQGSNNTITLNGSNFEFQPSGATSGSAAVTLNNPFTVTAAGGGLFGENSSSNQYTIFAGPIALGGQLTINGQNNSGAANYNRYTGTITVAQTTPGVLPGLAYQQNGASYQSSLDSVIQDGAGNAQNPVTLRSAINQSTFNVTGASTYANGTIIRGAVGLINVTAAGQSIGTPSITYAGNAQLGTGNVNILAGGKLRLNAAANVNTAGGAQIIVAGTSIEQGALGIAYNPASQAALGIASTSNGLLAIDSGTFTANLDLSTLGDGTMFLGSTAGGTYGGTTLGASGGVYHLGGGSATLTVSNPVLIGATNSLQVGLPSGGAASIVDNGTTFAYTNGNAKLNAANTYGGGSTIYRNSTLEGVAQASGTPFGSTTSALAINGGTLQLDGTGSATTTDIGAATISGSAKFALSHSGSNTNTLRIASFNSRSASAPYAVAVQGSGTGGSQYLGVSEKLVMAGGQEPTVTNGMVAPYFYSTDGSNISDFLTYSGTGGTGSGFQKAAYTAVAANGLAGSGTGNQNNIVDLTGDQTLNANDNVTVYALHDSATRTISTSSATINVTSGGVLFSHDNGTDTVQPTLAFGSAEAVINVGRNNQSTTLNVLTGTGGLTKLGAGNLNLSAASPSLSGQISILNGSITITNDNQLGASANSLYLDGGSLVASNVTGSATSRNIVLGTSGGGFAVGSNGVNFNLNGNITGTGTLYKYAGGSGNLTLGGTANTYSGGTLITGSTIFVNANSSVGTGDVAIGGNASNGGVGFGSIVFTGDNNILGTATGGSPSTARLNLYAGSTATFQSGTAGTPGAPSIGSLEGSGNVVLGKTGNIADNLTVGGNNFNSLFDGTISQASGAATSNVTKVGTGTLALANAQTYTGNTAVNAGTLLLRGSLAGTAGVNNTASLGGTGLVSGAVTVGSSASIFAGVNDNTAGAVASTLSIGSGSSLLGNTLLDLTAINASDEILVGGGTGSLTLGGTLNVSNPNALTFAAGQSYDLFGFGSGLESGTFSTLNLPALTGLSWDTSNLYTTGIITIGGGGPASGSAAWIASGSGDWETAANWNPAQIPSAAGQTATFASSIGATDAVVNLTANETVGTVAVNNTSTGSYTIGSTASKTLTLDNGASAAAITVTGSGNLTLSSAVVLNSDTNASVDTGRTLTVAGAVTSTAGKTLTESGTGTLLVATSGSVSVPLTVNGNVTFAASNTAKLIQTVPGLTVGSSGLVTVADLGSSNHANRTVLVTNSLANSGKIDLNGNDLIVHNGDLTAITAQLASGYGSDSSYWNGPAGIVSSTARNDGSYLTTLGVMKITSAGTTGGDVVAANDVLVKYTWYGDADLSGTVDGTDYSQIDLAYAGNVANPGTYGGWSNGDFNYDGKIDGSDYTLIDNAFNLQGTGSIAGPLSMIAANTSEIAPAVSGPSGAVPEPTSLGLLAVGALGMLSRRRRR